MLLCYLTVAAHIRIKLYTIQAMLSVRSLVAILAVALFSADLAAAFAPTGSNAGRAVTSALNVMGPKQAAAMEKLKNPAKYEQTIQGLMSQKGLTRGQAEKRYGEFLADPDGASFQLYEFVPGRAMFARWPLTHNQIVFFSCM